MWQDLALNERLREFVQVFCSALVPVGGLAYRKWKDIEERKVPRLLQIPLGISTD